MRCVHCLAVMLLFPGHSSTCLRANPPEDAIVPRRGTMASSGGLARRQVEEWPGKSSITARQWTQRIATPRLRGVDYSIVGGRSNDASKKGDDKAAADNIHH